MVHQARTLIYSRMSTDTQANGMCVVESIRDTASGYTLDQQPDYWG